MKPKVAPRIREAMHLRDRLVRVSARRDRFGLRSVFLFFFGCHRSVGRTVKSFHWAGRSMLEVGSPGEDSDLGGRPRILFATILSD